MTNATLPLPFQPEAMSPAQLGAVSYLARYTGHTHTLYAYQLQSWFTWCQTNALDQIPGPASSAPTSSCTSATCTRPVLMDSSINEDDARRARLPPVRPHRRAHHRRPGDPGPAAQGAHR